MCPVFRVVGLFGLTRWWRGGPRPATKSRQGSGGTAGRPNRDCARRNTLGAARGHGLACPWCSRTPPARPRGEEEPSVFALWDWLSQKYGHSAAPTPETSTCPARRGDATLFLGVLPQYVGRRVHHVGDDLPRACAAGPGRGHRRLNTRSIGDLERCLRVSDWPARGRAQTTRPKQSDQRFSGAEVARPRETCTNYDHADERREGRILPARRLGRDPAHFVAHDTCWCSFW